MRPAVLFLVAALAISLATPASAAAIDLVIDEGAAVSWNENGIVPGEEGESVVVLRNAGSRPGTLTLWVSNLTETDGGDDGAALGRYLLFTLSAERLESRVKFPATLAAFPHGPDDRNAIQITGLDAGESVALTWHWEFQETYTPQNDAQGDTLSFEVTYLLTEAPPSPAPTGHGGGRRVHSVGVPGSENMSIDEGRAVVTLTPLPFSPVDTGVRGPIYPWLLALLYIGLLLLLITVLAYTYGRAKGRGIPSEGSERERLIRTLALFVGLLIALFTGVLVVLICRVAPVLSP